MTGFTQNLPVGTSGAVVPLLNTAVNFSGTAAASTPSLLLSSSIFSGGTGTTTFPTVFIQPTGTTAATTWSTGGTAFGINLENTTTSNFIDCKLGTSLSVYRFGATNGAAWTTNGKGLQVRSQIWTDTTSSGTIAAEYINAFLAPTLAFSSATTVTNAYNTYIVAPVAGTNATLTNGWALGTDSLKVGTSGTFTVSTAGVLTTTGAQLTTPNLGVASATSLALGGATIGTDTFGVTGTSTLSGATVISGASFGLSGNISQAAWTTAGVRYKNVAATLTDTTSSGTVAAAYTDIFGGNTIAASSAVTFTKYATMRIPAPIAGTNVTFTNSFALDVDSINVGTSGTFKVSTAGVLTTTGAQLTTPTLGVSTGTSLTLGGATIGTDALGVVGTATISGASVFSSTVTGGSFIPTSSTVPTNGMYLSSANVLNWSTNSISRMSLSAAGVLSNTGEIQPGTDIKLGNTRTLYWGTQSQIYSGANGNVSFANSNNTNSVIISFPTATATPTLQLGAADAAVAVAQTLRVQSVVAGTAAANGANWTLIGSLPTGTGTSGDIIIQTGVKTGSGTTQGTATTALTIKGETQAITIASGKSLVLGNAATTGLTAGVLAALTNATIVITDSTGQAYRIPCII